MRTFSKSLILLSAILLISSFSVYAQVTPEALRSEAQSMMQKGKYGEAIELLNKYISARPKAVDGYTLRGICYEKRGQMENAAVDFRYAHKLAPSDPNAKKNLDRLTGNWFTQLKNKIDGHRREIAINPNIAVNYLEIGKCYKHMGEWILAEEWYDKYLERAEPSADEVIRYTEILAKNNHLEKGEKILKRFTEKYPNDHRLWSRYGYFTLWLGKKKIAAEAFRKALELRPYFKEAMDGLEQAEDKPYIYTYYDTTDHDQRNQGNKGKSRPIPQEFAIDKYYRIVKANPQDTATRYLLVEELVKYERLEEANDQLQILVKDVSEEPRYQLLYDTVSARRERIMAARTIEFRQRNEANPYDKTAALGLADIFAQQLDYDNATKVLAKYLDNKGMKEELDVRFMLARYSAWNYQFENAVEQMDGLLAVSPNSLDYQLFRAQIAVWTTTDSALAHQYLNNVLASQPQNLQALTGLATLYIRERNFTDGLTKINEAETVSPGSKEVEAVKNYYDVNLALEEDRRNFELLVQARETAAAGDCITALAQYDDYLSRITAPNRIELIEYADVNSCAKNYSKAIEIYDQLLIEEYDYDLALLRAKTKLWGGDSLTARDELTKLSLEDTTSFDARFYLAQAYEYFQDYDRAREIYDSLLITTTDTIQRGYVNQRIGWLPHGTSTGDFFTSLLGSFPMYTRIAPSVGYYADNQSLRFLNTQGMIELGIFSNFAVNMTFGRMFLNGKAFFTDVHSYFTSLKFGFQYQPFPTILLMANTGTLSQEGWNRRRITEAGIRYEKEKKISLMLLYIKTDAAMLLYSAPLVYNRYDAEMYKLIGWYQPGSTSKFSGRFSYITFSDGNAANDAELRIGKKFDENIWAGYEYLYTNFSYTSRYYYSPSKSSSSVYDSHSIWGEYTYPIEDGWDVTAGAKLGYVISADVIIKEANVGMEYKWLNRLTFSAKLTVGNSSRDYSSYSYTSMFASLYWGIF